MPDTPSITINKKITYRGKDEITSNTYHFSGTTPANQADWEALALAIWNAEKPVYDPMVKYAGFLGYAAGNNHAVAMRDFYSEGGALLAGQGNVAGGGALVPGDVAAYVRWRTPGKTSRGKTIYLSKYIHGVWMSTSDTLNSGYATALATYAAKMIDGTLPGGVKVCGPQGAVASAPFVSPFLTTHTLKRRGKRPH